MLADIGAAMPVAMFVGMGAEVFVVLPVDMGADMGAGMFVAMFVGMGAEMFVAQLVNMFADMVAAMLVDMAVAMFADIHMNVRMQTSSQACVTVNPLTFGVSLIARRYTFQRYQDAWGHVCAGPCGYVW